MIFKLQRPITSSDGNQDVLAYDESREYEGVVPMTADLRKLFGQELKIFVEGSISIIHDAVTIHLNFNSKVQDPNW